MNEHDDANGLPYLEDADVELLYAICERATKSNDPPIKSLFAAYDALFNEKELESQHDGAIFRYLMRVGDRTRAANRERRPIDLVGHLKSILEGLGITLLEPSEIGEDDRVSVAADTRHVQGRAKYRRNRSVSFDDAQFEETWLSEHTQSVQPSPARPAPRGLLSLPPRRGRHAIPGRRTRSISTQRDSVLQSTAPSKAAEQEESAEPEHKFNPTLYFEPSQTELELNAEAFLSTTALRSARQAINTWHQTVLQLRRRRIQDDDTAVAYDGRILLKEAFSQWRTMSAAALSARRKSEREERMWDIYEKRAGRARDLRYKEKAFTNWVQEGADERLRTEVARRHMLKFSFFNRWRAIATENQAKIRSVLCRKYLAVWRERTVRKQVWGEQATAYYEETLMRKCKSRWFWQFCSQRVEGWHEQWVERRALGRLADACRAQQQRGHQAEELRCSRLLRRTFSILATKLKVHQADSVAALQHHDRVARSTFLFALRTQSVLVPITRTVEQSVGLTTVRKALRVWRLHLALTRQAAEVDRQRILQTAWTNWNDALRCRALSQKINERLLVENLYRWVLQERLRLFQRTTDGQIVSRALHWWRAKVDNERDRLADAEVVFAERQRRRRLANGMLQLNIAMRAREDAERAAIEISMSRALPKTVVAWRDKADHVQRLSKWAADARFYCLCSSTLKTWKDRMMEHVANRRRDAYVQVRVRVKVRLVRDSLVKLRSACIGIQSMTAEAERRAQARIARTAGAVVEQWRAQTARHFELDNQAYQLNQRKLQGSAWEALRLRHADFERMATLALEFRHEVDLALLAGALRRWQWATFTAYRKVESAEALWLRNRDQHVKQMMRHWSAQTAARRSTTLHPEQQDEDPDSPSLRPASRAASRSAGPDVSFLSSPPTQEQLQSTPGYMRTPSRPRRAGRFRPLPTPAAVTPLAFDSAYLATTPTPLPGGRADGRNGTEGLTPQITPFSRKLRAGGVASILRRPNFGRSIQDDTSKSVRFAGLSRFRTSSELHIKSS